MSFKAMTWAMRQRPASASEKMVLVFLAYCLNDKTKQCTPSVATIADETRQSKRTVHSVLSKLEAAGLISKRTIFDPKSRACVGCEYAFPALEESPHEAVQILHGGHADSAGGRCKSRAKVMKISHGGDADFAPKQGIEQGKEQGIYLSFVKTPESDPQIANDDVDEKPAQKTERKKDWLIDPNVVVEIYRRVLPELSDIRELTQARKSAIEARAENAMKVNKVKREELEGWFETYFQRVSQSSFLMGRTGKSKWRAYFDWLFNPTNVNKVLEGNYDDRAEDDSTEEYWIGRKAVSRFKGGAMKPKKRMNGILTQADLDSFSDEDWLK